MASMQELGHAWALLGLLRLQLLAPNPGVDPASKPFLERAAILHETDAWLQVEKKVRLPLKSLLSSKFSRQDVRKALLIMTSFSWLVRAWQTTPEGYTLIFANVDYQIFNRKDRR